MVNAPYAMTRLLRDTDLASARQRITGALGEEGFGVMTEIDVKATLKRKLDVDIEPYIILGACNPRLAHVGLSEDPSLGLLLPCNVVVAKTAEGIEISVVDPVAMLQLSRSKAVASIAAEARERLARALEKA